MKIKWIHFFNASLCGLALIGLAQPQLVRGQTYNFSSPVNGNQEISFLDYNTPGGDSRVHAGYTSTVHLGNINGSVIYNSTAKTVHFIGDVSVDASTFTGSFFDITDVFGVPTPPNAPVVSLNYQIGNVNNGRLHIDTGTLNEFVVQGLAGQFTQDHEWLLNVLFPISGTFSLATGGKTYTGGFNYNLNLPVLIDVLSNTPANLIFSEQIYIGGTNLNLPLALITTDNGMTMDLRAGDPSDGSTHSGWINNTITASLSVPESGSSLVLFSFGVLALAMMRWLCPRAHGRNLEI